jgi:hypothetical protein
MQKAVIFVNKYWECDAVMSALLNEDVRDVNLPLPRELNYPRDRKAGLPPKPRATYVLRESSIEVWCVSDFLERSDATLQSSTEEKAKVLAPFFQEVTMDCLVAVGTAGFPSSTTNLNGGVLLGTNVFLHDGHPIQDPNKLSQWRGGTLDKIVPSRLTREDFAEITGFDHNGLSTKLVKAPNNPSTPFPVANHSFVSLGTVNVTDYREYSLKDVATSEAFSGLGSQLSAASLETTHGLLRTLGPSEFIFVSGITDKLGSFNLDVTSGQNFAASFNAGVVVSALIPRIAKLIS